jgi:hypothetical protein
MRYERPTIIRRELVEALLLDTVDSDVAPDGVRSDVHRKENIRAVVWPADRVRYAAPAIDRREPVAGLLIVAKSENQPQPDGVPSDRAIKGNVVPVVWDATTPIAYAKPVIAQREPVAALLTVAKSEQGNDVLTSDVHRKENVRPVTWHATRRVGYTTPAIDRREPLQALLDAVPNSDNPQKDVSDRNRKDNVLPVRW